MDAGTLLVTNDALDDQIAKDAVGFGNALATGSWVAAALLGVGLLTAVIKKFGLGVKKIDPPAPATGNQDADKAADQARNLLNMKEKE